MVICLEQGADLHTAQLMPLPLTVSCFSKIQIGFTFLVLAHLGSPGQRAVKRVCVCVCVCVCLGERSKLPSGSGRNPAAKRFWCIPMLKMSSFPLAHCFVLVSYFTDFIINWC